MTKYQQVEYIESSGTQYIDTGVSIGIGDTFIYTYSNVYDGDTLVTSTHENKGYGQGNTTGSNPNISGGGRLNWSNMISIWVNGYEHQSSLSTTTKGTIYCDIIRCLSDKMIVQMLNNGTGEIYLNDIIYTTSYATKHMYFFKDSAEQYVYEGTKRLYGSMIMGNHNRYFVPCYRTSDNVIGLFDCVENKFYTNAGSGTFTKGPDITSNIAFNKSGVIDSAGILEVGSQVQINPLNYINTSKIKEC